MISTREEYLQANQALQEVEEALAALRGRLGEQRADLFAVMAQDYLDSIASIRDEIDAYTGLAAVRSDVAPLWFGLEGAGLSPQNVRTSILAGWLERLRKSVTAAAGLEIMERPARGRYPQSIVDACDFRLVGFRPGSLKVGLDMPEPAQMTLFDDVPQDALVMARRGLEDLLEAAARAGELQRSGDTIETAREQVSERQLVLFRQVLRLTPGRRERVRAVVLEGAMVPRRTPVRLDSSLRAILASILGAESEPARVEELEGTLREIDLDRKHFILRDRPEDQPDATVYFEPNLIEDAKRALDLRVRVEASRGTGPRPRLRALIIEALEDTPL